MTKFFPQTRKCTLQSGAPLSDGQSCEICQTGSASCSGGAVLRKRRVSREERERAAADGRSCKGREGAAPGPGSGGTRSWAVPPRARGKRGAGRCWPQPWHGGNEKPGSPGPGGTRSASLEQHRAEPALRRHRGSGGMAQAAGGKQGRQRRCPCGVGKEKRSDSARGGVVAAAEKRHCRRKVAAHGQRWNVRRQHHCRKMAGHSQRRHGRCRYWRSLAKW